MIFKEFTWKPFTADSKYNIELEVTIVPCKVEREGQDKKVIQVFHCQTINLSSCKTLNIERSLNGLDCLILDESGYGLAFETLPIFLELLRINPYWDQKSASDVVQEIGEKLLDYVVGMIFLDRVVDVVIDNSFSTKSV